MSFPLRSRVLARTAATTAMLALAAGCTSAAGGPPAASDSGEEKAAAAAPAPPVKLSATFNSGQQIASGDRVAVSARAGSVQAVTVRDEDGTTVPGKLTARGWRATGQLLPDTTYELTARAANTDGEPRTRTWRFSTKPAELTDFPAVTPLADSLVGVGHPVVVYLDHDVEYKEEFEQRLSVKTSKPSTGSWGWIDDRTVAYRPRSIWPANADVTVTLDVGKTQTAPGRWVEDDRTIRFRTGRSQVLRIDDATHTMKVLRDGKTIRTVPVSMGKPGFTTRSGVKVIMGREVSRRMDSATVGIGGSEAYDLEVPYALRLTSSGEFIHGAPWSEWAQGSRNVSHGCTNVSLSNAIWLYDNSLIGDPVITSGTGRQAEEWNGLGGIWNYSWAEWRDRSAST